MTPFRSYVVVTGSCVASVFAKALNLDAFPVYISVRSLMHQCSLRILFGARVLLQIRQIARAMILHDPK